MTKVGDRKSDDQMVASDRGAFSHENEIIKQRKQTMSNPDPALWREMLTYLRRHHGEICRQWFEELEPLWLEHGLLQVRANNTIQKNFLNKHGIEAFNDAAQDATGALVAVKFIGRDEQPTTATTKATKPQEKNSLVNATTPSIVPPVVVSPSPNFLANSISPTNSTPLTSAAHSTTSFFDEDELILSPDYTFDNFVTGPGNRLANAASVAVADQPGQAYNPLFIHGGVGLGKTHLLQAICEKMLRDNPQVQICYLSCDVFVNQFLESVSNGKMHEFRHRYRHVDMLIIDDIHFLTGRDRTQEEFFHTFNTLHQSRKQIVLSSDAAPNEIPQLEERLISRFNWGLVTHIDKPCYETRLAILRKKAQIRGIDLPDDVVCYIASQIHSNTRELEGAITKIQSLSMLNQEPITLGLTQNALGDYIAEPIGPQFSIQTIIDAVVEYYGVKLADLQSKRRHRSITTPRQICMYLARKRTNYSLEEIGGYFGGRDHTTVMHAVKIITDRIDEDSNFSSQIDHIDTELLTRTS